MAMMCTTPALLYACVRLESRSFLYPINNASAIPRIPFLLAAGLEAPKRVYAHGWWTKDGEKMSKSIGNVLDPFQLLDLYGKDYVRYDSEYYYYYLLY